MRTLRNLLCLAAMATSADLPTGWKALPPIPRGMPMGVAGDGPAVLAFSAGGGASALSGVRLGWSQLEKTPWVEGVVARGDLVGYCSREGLHYQILGHDTLLHLVDPVGSHLHTDGRRFVASFPVERQAPSLLLSVDSAATEITGASRVEPVRRVHWRRIFLPSPNLTSNVARGWISGELLLASDGSRTWLSRDTGLHFQPVPIGGLAEADLSGDTIVAKASGEGVFYSSRDGGAHWDSTTPDDKIRPERIAFRGGSLWGSLRSSSSSRYSQLVRSTDLGRSWKEVMAQFVPERGVASDGKRLWAFAPNGLMVQDPLGAAAWSAADSGLPEGVVAKFRSFHGEWLALQKEAFGDAATAGRLWSLGESGWKLLRRDVFDFEVQEAASRVLVTVPLAADAKPTSRYGLEFSQDLVQWTRDTAVAPAFTALGRSRVWGVLAMERTGVAAGLHAADWRHIALWAESFDQVAWVAAADSEFVWAVPGKGMFRQNRGAIDLGPQGEIRGFAAGWGGWGLVSADSLVGRLEGLTPPLKRVLSASEGSGVASNGDSVLCWSGWGGVVSMAKDGRVLTEAPRHRRVLLATTEEESFPAAVLRPLPMARVLNIADEHGRLWRWQDGFSALRSRPVANRREVELVPDRQGLSLRLDASGRVELEVFDPQGRSSEMVLARRLPAGVHHLGIKKTGNVLIARLRVDGAEAGVLRWLPPVR